MSVEGSAYGDRHMALERLIDKGGSHQPPTTGAATGRGAEALVRAVVPGSRGLAFF